MRVEIGRCASGMVPPGASSYLLPRDAFNLLLLAIVQLLKGVGRLGELLLALLHEAMGLLFGLRLLTGQLLGPLVGDDQIAGVQRVHGERALGTGPRACGTVHAVRGQGVDMAVVVEVYGVRDAGLGAIAAGRAAVRIDDGHVEGDVGCQPRVMLEAAHHELAVLGEDALAVLVGLRAHRVLELTLQLVQAVGVVGDLLGHRLGAGELGTRACHEALGCVNGGAHELAAAVLARELVREALAVGLEAHRRLGPLLRRADRLGVEVLAGCGAAAVADAERQVDGHVGVVHEDGEPQVARDHAHAREKHLVGLGEPLQGAGTRDVALLVGRGGASDVVVELFDHVTPRVEDLGGAGRLAKAALAAGVLDGHGLVVDVDRVRGAHVQAGGAHVLALRGAAQAAAGVAPGLLLVIRRVEDLALAWVLGKRVRDARKRVLDCMPTVLDVDDVIENVALPCHRLSRLFPRVTVRNPLRRVCRTRATVTLYRPQARSPTTGEKRTRPRPRTQGMPAMSVRKHAPSE